MKEEEKVEALQWFVHFANLDLERIGPGDRAKLLVESDCLWPVEELKDYGRLSPLSKQRLSDLAWTLEIPGKNRPSIGAPLSRRRRPSALSSRFFRSPLTPRRK